MVCARDRDSEFKDAILDACLHCYSVDPQCEGTRAAYMLELVGLLPDRNWYCDAVLKSLEDSGDDYDAVQRFHFATYMAMDGDRRAKEALYRNFNPGPAHGEAIGIDFIRLDGLQGFLFAAEKIGALLRTQRDGVRSGWFWRHAVETCGAEEVRTVLGAAAEINPGLEAYRSHVEEKPKDREPLGVIRKISWTALKPTLSRRGILELWEWGESASEADLESAAQDLANSPSRDETLQFLKIFKRRTFPLDPSVICGFACSCDKEVAEEAAWALAMIAHPQARETAFRLITQRLPGRDSAIKILTRNWQRGDHALALEWFLTETDRYIRHSMQRALDQLQEQHPDPESEPAMLLAAYEHGTCSFCRRYTIERLLTLNLLTPQLREECQYDANEDIRDLMKSSALPS